MRFLVLQHASHEGPGRYAVFAKRLGIQLDIVELWKPGCLMPAPSAYKKYDGAIIMGGPQGCRDAKKDYPSRDEEIEFIRGFDKPMLGHCLGSQLGAFAFGGDVYRDDRKECGFYPVRKSRVNTLFNGFNERFTVFHWHGDSFDLPQDAVPLVYSQFDPPAIQAFSYENRFFGVLFHMEMTPEMIRDLLKIDKAWFEKEDRKFNHGNTAQAIMQKAAELETQMERQAERLFSNFVSLC